MRVFAVVSLLFLILWPARPLSSAVSPTIRVGILREQDRAVITSDRPIEVVSGFTRLWLEPAAYEFVPGAIGIEAVGFAQFDGIVRLLPTSGGRLHVGIRPYRGILELRRTSSGRLTIVNELDLEEYLYGVLKMEIDPRWAPDALKAQAIASRTLALSSVNRFQAEGYDVRAGTDSQAYGGVTAEDPRTTAAVEETRGVVMTFDGRPILAVFHSDSGGHTESAELVWGGRYAYLRGVPDPYSADAPNHVWSLRLDRAAFEERLIRAGKLAPNVVAIEIVDVTPSNRVATVRITTPTGRVDLKGTELRAILGADVLRSTMFTVRMPVESPLIEFVGRGYGHGVGMSQWGARGQGLLGRTYAEILRYYYSGVAIESR